MLGQVLRISGIEMVEHVVLVPGDESLLVTRARMIHYLVTRRANLTHPLSQIGAQPEQPHTLRHGKADRNERPRGTDKHDIFKSWFRMEKAPTPFLDWVPPT